MAESGAAWRGVATTSVRDCTARIPAQMVGSVLFRNGCPPPPCGPGGHQLTDPSRDLFRSAAPRHATPRGPAPPRRLPPQCAALLCFVHPFRRSVPAPRGPAPPRLPPPRPTPSSLLSPPRAAPRAAPAGPAGPIVCSGACDKAQITGPATPRGQTKAALDFCIPALSVQGRGATYAATRPEPERYSPSRQQQAATCGCVVWESRSHRSTGAGLGWGTKTPDLRRRFEVCSADCTPLHDSAADVRTDC